MMNPGHLVQLGLLKGEFANFFSVGIRDAPGSLGKERKGDARAFFVSFDRGPDLFVLLL